MKDRLGVHTYLFVAFHTEMNSGTGLRFKSSVVQAWPPPPPRNILCTVWSKPLCGEVWLYHLTRTHMNLSSGTSDGGTSGRIPSATLGAEPRARAWTLLCPAVCVTSCLDVSSADDPVPQGTDWKCRRCVWKDCTLSEGRWVRICSFL